MLVAREMQQGPTEKNTTDEKKNYFSHNIDSTYIVVEHYKCTASSM